MLAEAGCIQGVCPVALLSRFAGGGHGLQLLGRVFSAASKALGFRVE